MTKINTSSNGELLGALEIRFLALKNRYPMLKHVFNEWLSNQVDAARASKDADLVQAIAVLIESVEEDSVNRKASQTLPPYHNAEHAKEVLIALHILLEEDSRLAPNTTWDPFTHREKLLLTCAAIGHDFLHPGGINREVKEFEERSANAVETILTQCHIATHEVSWVKEIILATDFDQVKSLHKHYKNHGKKASKLLQAQIILTEADVFASVLPGYGRQLSRKLAEEFQMTKTPRAEDLLTEEGRLRFLEKVCFSTPHASQLGLNNIISNIIKLG